MREEEGAAVSNGGDCPLAAAAVRGPEHRAPHDLGLAKAFAVLEVWRLALEAIEAFHNTS